MQNQKTLGRYRILGELGRGAMGAVFRAADPLIEREVAIKTLLPDIPPDLLDEVRERFLREARSAGRLNHPNIVTIFDVGEDAGVAYIAMELLAGPVARGLPVKLTNVGEKQVVGGEFGAAASAGEIAGLGHAVSP